MEKSNTVDDKNLIAEIVKRVQKAKSETPDMPYGALLLYHTGEVMYESREGRNGKF